MLTFYGLIYDIALFPFLPSNVSLQVGIEEYPMDIEYSVLIWPLFDPNTALPVTVLIKYTNMRILWNWPLFINKDHEYFSNNSDKGSNRVDIVPSRFAISNFGSALYLI